MLKKWDALPDFMKNDEVRVYYDSLQKKKVSIFLKRLMDLIGGLILLIILAIVLVALGLLYYFGNRMQKKQEAQQEQLAAAAQQVSLLVIDKKKMKLKDAGFPQVIVDNTPKYLRRSKVPVVKAKIGPRIMTMMCDTQIYDLIPVKKEVKATVSGIYITGVRGIRGSLETPQKKKGFFARLRNK